MRDFRDQVRACWLGKAIGGTLGMPYEGRAGPHGLTFYDPLPGKMVPNDDLDLQVVWMHHLLGAGVGEDLSELLAGAWEKHVRFPWDEYACCLRNRAYGLAGPQLGAFDNWFAECMGAAIRSEVWACLAPGDPARAAGLAWGDAVCDHAGDGVWAEVFLAALESAAFLEKDRERLLDLALDFLPSTSRVKQAVEDTRRWWSEALGAKLTRTRSPAAWLKVRLQILEKYGTGNFTDVAANLAFMVLGWLDGEGDFGRSLCTTTNCGLDADCTAASLGALLGILEPSVIPQRWKAPIGEAIALSPDIRNVVPPADLDELTEWTLRLREQLEGRSFRVGTVDPRLPPSEESSPIRIPATLGWRDELGGTTSTAGPRPLQGGRRVSLPGHWMRLAHEEFQRPVMVLECELTVEHASRLRILAFSSTETRAWVDGRPLDGVPSNPFCHNSDAPSFHRGGHGQFQTGPLAGGKHVLTVAWRRPDLGEEADLVLGAGEEESLLWRPFALGETTEVESKISMGFGAAAMAR